MEVTGDFGKRSFSGVGVQKPVQGASMKPTITYYNFKNLSYKEQTNGTEVGRGNGIKTGNF